MRTDLRTMTTLDARLLSATILITILTIAAEVLFKNLFMTSVGMR